MNSAGKLSFLPGPSSRNDLLTHAAFLPIFAYLSIRSTLEVGRAVHRSGHHGLPANAASGGQRTVRRGHLGRFGATSSPILSRSPENSATRVGSVYDLSAICSAA